MNGYIRVHRKFVNWEWYKNLITKSVFLHCLLKANWEDKKFEGNVIKRGSFVTGRKELAREIGISEQQLRTALNHLKSTNELTIKTTTKYTVISINNYDFYQLDNQEINQQLTNNQPTTNQQLTTTNKYKNIKNIKNINNTTTYNGENLFEFLEANFGRTLSPIEFEEVSTWEDSDLTRYAIRQAVLNGKYSIKYISKILYQWQVRNIKTVQDAQKDEEQWNQQKKGSKNDIVPEWFDKQIDICSTTDQEKKELNDILNSFERG